MKKMKKVVKWQILDGGKPFPVGGVIVSFIILFLLFFIPTITIIPLDIPESSLLVYPYACIIIGTIFTGIALLILLLGLKREVYYVEIK